MIEHALSAVSADEIAAAAAGAEEWTKAPGFVVDGCIPLCSRAGRWRWRVGNTVLSSQPVVPLHP